MKGAGYNYANRIHYIQCRVGTSDAGRLFVVLFASCGSS
jgi:hypothetical protein